MADLTFFPLELDISRLTNSQPAVALDSTVLIIWSTSPVVVVVVVVVALAMVVHEFGLRMF